MDWDKLKIFHAVAEAGSFTSATVNLNLSQSAISRQIQSLERDLILNLRALFKPFGRVQAPIVFGSLGIAAAASLSLSVSISESWVIRLTISPFLVTVLNVFNNWVTGSFSPTEIEGEKKKDQAKTLKQKLRFLTLVLVLSYVIFGPEWLSSDVASQQSLIRIGIVSVLVISMINL